MRRYAPFIIVGAVALLTLGGGLFLYRTMRPAPLPMSAAQPPETALPFHYRGKTTAPVLLEEFADFQCPPCGRLAAVLKELETTYPDQLGIAFRHFPLANHQNAVPAAIAAEAAHAQGRFWEMHDFLYREQGTWSAAPDPRPLFVTYAGTLKLDLERFQKDLDNPKLRERILTDQKYAGSLGVKNTPTVFINKQPVPANVLTPAALAEAVKEAVAKSAAPAPK